MEPPFVKAAGGADLEGDQGVGEGEDVPFEGRWWVGSYSQSLGLGGKRVG